MSRTSDETSLNRLLAFYYGSHPDDHGRMLAEILRQNDYWFEVCHNYIQWLFPTREFSRVTPDAPILDKVTIGAFLSDDLLRNHLRAALFRILSFYGLALTVNGVDKGSNWHERKSNWFTQNTHNSLRITRILKSLNALGLASEAKAFGRALLSLCETEPDCGVGAVTLKFWRDASLGVPEPAQI